MECACIYDEPDSYTDELSCKLVVSRKNHKCGECSCDIKKGDIYESFVGVNEGHFYTHKTCADCLSIRDKFFCSGWHWGMILERLQEHIDEMYGQISADCILSLTSGAQLIVFDYIESTWRQLELDNGEEEEL